LIPIQKEESEFIEYTRFKSIKVNLEVNDYPDTGTFYQQNNIAFDNGYHEIIWERIRSSRVFLKVNHSKSGTIRLIISFLTS